MRILVTGGAGFIGSHVVDTYLEAGHEVAVVDDLSTGTRENVNDAARFYEIPIQSSDLETVFKEFKPDIVNHHAAHIDLRKSVIEPMHDADINVMGSLNILTLIQKYGIGKIIFSSTGGAIYGEPEHVPVTEALNPVPLSPYGANKLVVEHYLRIWNILHGVKYTIFRYPNVYGPRQNPKGEAGVVAIFSLKMLGGEIPTIFGDGSKTRDYLYVTDIAAANLLALDKGDGEILNLGWGAEIRDIDVFTNVRNALNVTVEPSYEAVRKGEVNRIALDAGRAAEKLGWVPQIDFETGTRLATEYYRKYF